MAIGIWFGDGTIFWTITGGTIAHYAGFLLMMIVGNMGAALMAHAIWVYFRLLEKDSKKQVNIILAVGLISGLVALGCVTILIMANG